MIVILHVAFANQTEMDLFAEPGNTGPNPLPIVPAEVKDNVNDLLKESVQTKLKKIEDLSENDKINASSPLSLTAISPNLRLLGWESFKICLPIWNYPCT